jgi:hypothetical protein
MFEVVCPDVRTALHSTPASWALVGGGGPGPVLLGLLFGIVRQEWSPDDVVGSWTLVGADWRLVGNKTGATRLGFALLLKFFEIEAWFPRDGGEFPAAAVAYVAEQVKVDPAEFVAYPWTGVPRSTTGRRSGRRSGSASSRELMRTRARIGRPRRSVRSIRARYRRSDGEFVVRWAARVAGHGARWSSRR